MKRFMQIMMLVSIGLSMPLHLRADNFAGQESVPIKSVCKINVNNAACSYALEVQRAPYAQWAVGLSTAAVVGTLAYKIFFAQSQPTVATNDEKIRIMEDKIYRYGLDGGHYQTYLNPVIDQQKIAVAQKDWWQSIKSNGWWLGSMLLSQGILGAGSALVVTPVLEALVAGKKMLPTSGSLQWYIADRTGYQRNLEDLIHYSQHEVLRPSFNSVVHLFVSDNEKILGYLQVFRSKLDSAEVALINRCNHYRDDLERLVNEFINLTNSEAAIEDLRAKLFGINQVVDSAQQFVKQNYR